MPDDSAARYAYDSAARHAYVVFPQTPGYAIHHPGGYSPLCVAKMEKDSGDAKDGGPVDPDISPSKILSGAMGIAVALAWNDAVKSIINRIYPGGGQTALVLYAIFVTIFVVAVVWAINAGNKIVQNVSDIRKEKLKNYGVHASGAFRTT